MSTLVYILHFLIKIHMYWFSARIQKKKTFKVRQPSVTAFIFTWDKTGLFCPWAVTIRRERLICGQNLNDYACNVITIWHVSIYTDNSDLLHHCWSVTETFFFKRKNAYVQIIAHYSAFSFKCSVTVLSSIQLMYIQRLVYSINKH